MFKFFNFRKNNNQGIKKYPNVKIGLALGGGAARGIAHIGVIKAFEEAGLKFDFVAGTSAGSLIGAFYCAGKTSSEMIEIVKNIKEKDIRTSKVVFMPSKTAGLEQIILNNLGDINIEDLIIPFSPVVVDLKTTNEIALRHGNLAKAVAGSCAIPGVFVPVAFEDKLLVDGGLQNTIPSDIPKMFGCDYVISVDVNSTRTYGTDSTKILDVLLASTRILMKNTPIKGYFHSDCMLAPDAARFRATKLDGYMEMVDEGYKCAKQHMDEILAIFARKPVKKKFKKSLVFARDLNIVNENGIKSLVLKKRDEINAEINNE